MEDKITLSSYCTQTFTILDQWLNQVSGEKGDQALEYVKKAMRNNIADNITYYDHVAFDLEKREEFGLAMRNRRLAEIYRGLFD